MRLIKKHKRWSLKVAQAIAVVMNESPTMSVAETMQIVGLGLYVYVTMVNEDLAKEEQE